MNRRYYYLLFATLCSIISHAPAAGSSVPPAPLGVSYPAWKTDGYADAARHIAELRSIGFSLVSFVPTYTYSDLNKIDFSTAPDWKDYASAVRSALEAGLAVVLKPHLDPAIYQPGFDEFKTGNHSWRTHAAWRGFFDVDPMCDDYKGKIIDRTLEMARDVFSQLPRDKKVPPIRLELGTELMDSIVYMPDRWVLLVEASRKKLEELGLRGRVLLSYNFTHHIEIPEDFVLRMPEDRRGLLARYIRELDAVAISQYMDLTAAVPSSEKDKRPPTADEIAGALALHERNFREIVLERHLGLKPGDIPPLHIGEFGVGRGGLKHPNLWSGAATPEQEQKLSHEIALGMDGLTRYLSMKKGRTVQSAVLWTTGRHYDIFGWIDSSDAVPEAVVPIRAYLKANAP